METMALEKLSIAPIRELTYLYTYILRSACFDLALIETPSNELATSKSEVTDLGRYVPTYLPIFIISRYLLILKYLYEAYAKSCSQLWY